MAADHFDSFARRQQTTRAGWSTWHGLSLERAARCLRADLTGRIRSKMATDTVLEEPSAHPPSGV